MTTVYALYAHGRLVNIYASAQAAEGDADVLRAEMSAATIWGEDSVWTQPYELRTSPRHEARPLRGPAS
jgi:hypothetical protein